MQTKILVALAVGVAAAALAAGHANAQQVPDAVKTAASATEKGLKKAEEAVTHAAKVAASSVEFGLGKAGEAVNHTARRLGLPAGPAPAPVPPRPMVEAKR